MEMLQLATWSQVHNTLPYKIHLSHKACKCLASARGLGKDSRTKKSPQFSCSLFPKLSEEGKVYDSYAVLFLLL